MIESRAYYGGSNRNCGVHGVARLSNGAGYGTLAGSVLLGWIGRWGVLL